MDESVGKTDGRKTIKRKPADRRSVVLAVLLGFLYAAASLAGASLEKNGALVLPDRTSLIRGGIFWIVSSVVIYCLWSGADRVSASQSVRRSGTSGKVSLFGTGQEKTIAEPVGEKTLSFRARWMLCWGLLCLIDLISLLAVYPGFFVYDASEELAMVQSRSFTTHHPLLHVLLLGGIILAVHKITSSWNAGIFLYLLLQMMVMNGAFLYMLSDLAGNGTEKDAFSEEVTRDRREKGLIRFCFLWVAFCPVITMFVICSCKDGLFAASLMVMTVELRHILCEFGYDGAKESRIHFRRFVFAASLMMLFRNNGVYAYVVFFVISALSVGIHQAVISHKKKKTQDGELLQQRSLCSKEEFSRSSREGKTKEKKAEKRKSLSGNQGIPRLLLLLALPIAVYFGVSRGLAAGVHATSYESQEILTVPIMQLGRTWQASPESFTADEKELMAELVDEPDGWDAYNPALSDQLKLHFRSDVYRNNRKAFWALWLHQAKMHPMTYLNAWLMTSYGFWYPEAVIDCYRGNTVYTFTYGDSAYFGYETEQPGIRHSLIPVLDSWYRFLSLDVCAQKIPVLHLFLAPGMMAWVFAFLLFDLWRKKKRRLLLVWLPTFLVWLTVLLGPCTLPRYVVYLWFELPLMLRDCFFPGKQKEVGHTDRRIYEVNSKMGAKQLNIKNRNFVERPIR